MIFIDNLKRKHGLRRDNDDFRLVLQSFENIRHSAFPDCRVIAEGEGR